MTTRALLVYEQELLQCLVAANQQYLVDPVSLETLEVEEIDEFGSLRFKRQPHDDLRQHKLPVEGTLTDKDGVEVHALLFACAGKLDELQIYKDDGSPIRTVPKSEEWRIA